MTFFDYQKTKIILEIPKEKKSKSKSKEFNLRSQKYFKYPIK